MTGARTGAAGTSGAGVSTGVDTSGVSGAADDVGAGAAELVPDFADAVSVLDAFHVVKLGGQVVDDARRRVQQTIHGHRGRRDDPLYKIRNVLRCAEERLTERQQARLAAVVEADERHLEVFVAWQCAQQLRRVYHQPDPAAGRRLAEQIVTTFPSCPIPEVARLGRTLKKWRREFLAYFDTAVTAYWRHMAMPYHEAMAQLEGDHFVRKATLEFIASTSLSESKPRLLRNEPACAVEIKIIFRGCLEGKDEVPEDDTET